jgi:hypothetical protein
MPKYTRYFLAGGSDRRYDHYGINLSAAIKESIVEPKILSCFFSQEKEIWNEKATGWESWFRNYFGEGLEYKVATIDGFLDEIEWADVIYLHGGTTALLLGALEKFTNLEKAFEGKIIVGSSAGTNYLSKTFFSPKRNVVGEGSGIVKINTIVHYGASSDGEVSLTRHEWAGAVERMKSIIGGEAIVLLPEGEFISIVK